MYITSPLDNKNTELSGKSHPSDTFVPPQEEPSPSHTPHSSKDASPPHTPAQSSTAVDPHALSQPLNTASPPHTPAQSSTAVPSQTPVQS